MKANTLNLAEPATLQRGFAEQRSLAKPVELNLAGFAERSSLAKPARFRQAIDWNRLIRIEADSNYCRLFLENGRMLFVAKVLKQFEAALDRQLFVRPHKTHLVNKSFITSYNKGVHASLVLSNGDQIPVARRKKGLFSSSQSLSSAVNLAGLAEKSGQAEPARFCTKNLNS